MPQEARVSSIEAIASFRVNLLNYLTKTRPLLEDACDEVSRLRQWLTHDRRMHWENALRRSRRQLEDAQQALYSARISNLREPSSAETAAVTRVQRAVQEAEEKLRLIKRWTTQFDHLSGPLVKQLEQLRTMLGNDMPKAAAHLAQLIGTLEDYANVRPSLGQLPSPPAAAAEPGPAPADPAASPEAL